MKSCPRCGAPNREGAVYCDSCGVTLGVGGIWNGDTASSPGSQEQQQTWSKKGLNLGGLYRSELVHGPGGTEIRTESSFMGVRETSSYPRWMITSMAFFFAGLLVFLGIVLMFATQVPNRLEFEAIGAGVVGIGLLLGYAIYRIYYTPPRSTR